MNDKSAARQVLTGLVLLLATAGAVLAVTLIWPRAHAPVSEAPSVSTAATPPIDLSVYLPSPSEYPPGFTVPNDTGIAHAEFAFTTAVPGQPTPAPCAPESSLPAQLPTGDTPAQLHIAHLQPAGSASLSIAIADAGEWKDLSPIRTRLAQCPHQDSSGITCTDTEYQPVPAVSADDVIVVESRCRSGFDFRYRTYYAITRGRLVYISASGDDPRPAEGVLGLVVTKMHGATAPH
ncbi:hypothetical protein [Mycobacteroides salmoniphilum]|uniref:hypothetical protein n=1 Tax=Mycobacteroides salmoniphilum TaxID=404941 RepID=UPI000994695C|nr:hypothetical protein [Mycobacteroides salmoniphilum]QCH26000.1 hypothetical protein DSM43276_04287 [Mycobacteroides salmoniphilum]